MLNPLTRSTRPVSRTGATAQALEPRVFFHAGHEHVASVVESIATSTSQATPARAVPLGLAGQQLLPDLAPLASTQYGYIHGWVVDTSEKPGRDLLRLTSAIVNRGQGALELRGGTVLPGGAKQEVIQRVYQTGGSFTERVAGTFIYHPSHGHIHMEAFAIYRLRAVTANDGVGDVVREGDKTSFCIGDNNRRDAAVPGSPTAAHYVNCDSGVQGLSLGWADVYLKNLPDQWVDVTGVPDGSYWLEVEADPDGHVAESDETNNVNRIKIDLNLDGGDPAADRFEPNGNFEAATDLGTRGTGNEAGLSIHPATDQDVFRFTAASTGNLTIATESPAGAGNIDLYLYDGDRASLAESAEDGANESVTVPVAAGATYYARVSAPSGGTNVNYTLKFMGLGPTVGIAATDATSSETAAGATADEGTFTVTRNGPTDALLTVRYAVTGTAANGTDFTALTGTVVIPVLQTSATIKLQPTDDVTTEGSETVTVTLSTDAAYSIDPAAGSATATVLDDETTAAGPWSGVNVGVTGAAGTVTLNNDGSLRVEGAGAGLPAGKADAFYFAQQQLTGDGGVISRLSDWPTDGAAAAKAGVVIRDDLLGAGAAEAALLVAGDGSLLFQTRKKLNAALKVRTLARPAGTPPLWLRLTRAGKVITAWTSADGDAWAPAGTLKLSRAIGPLYAGVATTSGDPAQVAVATFADAAVLPPPPAPAAFTAAASATSPQVDLAWTWSGDASTGATFEVERSRKRKAGFRPVATVAATATAYADTSDDLVSGKRYFYRVRAANAGGASAYVTADAVAP